MRKNNVSDERMKEALKLLLIDLATELDLHYDDEDFFALTHSVERMKLAVDELHKLGGETPEAVAHVFARYHKARN
jgi:hypothetical protein